MANFLIMGMLGILIYNLFKAKEYIANNTFILAIFIKENLAIWLWAFCVIVVATAILYIEPNANAIIRNLSGLDLANTKTGWLLFGAGLCGLFRNVKKKNSTV
ncbi:hypothetical protein GCM10022289_07870 [Pedobacter jeongneungensis]|uniref:Uncharacterized protein n=1 Tax=Pedobacter jeongneungensis TaxID=947309 RepID=A0ABP8B667_9SPHI